MILRLGDMRALPLKIVATIRHDIWPGIEKAVHACLRGEEKAIKRLCFSEVVFVGNLTSLKVKNTQLYYENPFSSNIKIKQKTRQTLVFF